MCRTGLAVGLSDYPQRWQRRVLAFRFRQTGETSRLSGLEFFHCEHGKATKGAHVVESASNEPTGIPPAFRLPRMRGPSQHRGCHVCGTVTPPFQAVVGGEGMGGLRWALKSNSFGSVIRLSRIAHILQVHFGKVLVRMDIALCYRKLPVAYISDKTQKRNMLERRLTISAQVLAESS